MKKVVITIAVVLGIGLIVGAIAYGYHRVQLRNRVYSTYDITASKELSGEFIGGYLETEDGILRYTRDGASVIDGDLKEVWNVSYNMSEPIASACGHYAAIGDKGAKEFYIIDGGGDMKKIVTNYSIEKLAVAAQGVTAAWMDDGKRDYITIYQKDATVLGDMEIPVSKDGFPVDIALSRDGTRLITDYVDFEDQKMISQLTFYNFGEVGKKNYVGGLVGQDKYENTLYADVRFLNDRTAVAFGTDGFIIYNYEEMQDVVKNVTVSDRILRVSCSDQYIGLLVDSKSQGTNYLVRLYDLKGNLVEERGISLAYQHFQVEGDCIVLYSDTAFLVYRIKGKVKIDTVLDKSADCILPVDDQNHFLVIGSRYAEHIKLIGELK